MLERLVPAALDDLWTLLLRPSAKAAASAGGWQLVFRGKKIDADVLEKRARRRKNLMTGLRAGRPFAQHDALQGKLGPSTSALLSAPAAARKWRRKGKAGSKRLNVAGHAGEDLTQDGGCTVGSEEDCDAEEGGAGSEDGGGGRVRDTAGLLGHVYYNGRCSSAL